jgi:hypothetical protein
LLQARSVAAIPDAIADEHALTVVDEIWLLDTAPPAGTGGTSL